MLLSGVVKSNRGGTVKMRDERGPELRRFLIGYALWFAFVLVCAYLVHVTGWPPLDAVEVPA